MTITLTTHAEWVQTIAALVREGVQFHASHFGDETFNITLTGGY